MKKSTRYLKYQFTETELRDKATQLARECRQNEEMEDEKKSVVSDFKAKIDGLQAKISLLSGHINNGYEYRNIECEVSLNTPVTGKKTITRTDTGERVGIEDMDHDELQEVMDFSGEVSVAH